MRRILLVTVALLVTAFAGEAVANSPHFIGRPSISQDGNSLVINFKAAGLGNDGDGVATFNLSGDVNVFSRCYNRGGNKPQADNKQETIAVNATSDFAVTNGQTTGSFTITPLSTLTCPGNQVVRIESVSANLTLTGEGLTAQLTL